jgi:hypothetical protein
MSHRSILFIIVLPPHILRELQKNQPARAMPTAIDAYAAAHR